jgi:hypothetical protein
MSYEHLSLAERYYMRIPFQIKPLITGYIKRDWSPGQIAGRLEKEGIIKLRLAAPLPSKGTACKAVSHHSMATHRAIRQDHNLRQWKRIQLA